MRLGVWHTIQSLGRQRQEDYCEVKASLIYIERDAVSTIIKKKTTTKKSQTNKNVRQLSWVCTVCGKCTPLNVGVWVPGEHM